MEQREQHFPRQASALRRVLQALVFLAGWFLFVYWWWLVFQRVSREEVVFSAVFIGVTAVIMIIVTGLWSLHNKRLSRRKAPRNKARPVHEDYSRDTLLRTVTFVGGVEQLKRDPFVRVKVVADRKTYRPASAPEREPGGAPPAQGRTKRGPIPGHA